MKINAIGQLVKTNPIKPNFQKAKMNVNLALTKDYRKKDDFAVRKNKPRTNPISIKPKMNVSLYVTKEYENETAFKPKNTNPNKPNFKRDGGFHFECRNGKIAQKTLISKLFLSQVDISRRRIFIEFPDGF